MKLGLGRPIQILRGFRDSLFKGFQKAILKTNFSRPGKKQLNQAPVFFKGRAMLLKTCLFQIIAKAVQAIKISNHQEVLWNLLAFQAISKNRNYNLALEIKSPKLNESDFEERDTPDAFNFLILALNKSACFARLQVWRFRLGYFKS